MIQASPEKHRVEISSAECRANIIVLLSLPRFGPLKPMLDLVRSSGMLGLRIHERTDSVYWGQTMTRVMEEALRDFDKQPPDPNQVILTIDYDTPHKWEDIFCLYGMMRENPHVDAMCAFQMRRECNEALIMARGPDGEMLDRIDGKFFAEPLVKLAAGHFGLTMIRASSLRNLPHPWFCATPGSDGRWGDGHVDEDLSFWRKWEETGRTLYCCHEIAVAHGQWVWTWPAVIGKQLGPLHQTMADFQLRGKPIEAVGTNR